MRTTTAIVGAGLALMLMSACARPVTVQPTTTPTPAPPTVVVSTPTPDVNAELTRNQKKWRAANVRNYRFQLMVGCYCPMTAMMPITVEVRDGTVVSLTDSNGVVVAPNDQGSDFFRQYATIDSIYAELTSVRFNDADKLTITYDPTYGFPSEVSADFIEMAVDDELYLGVTEFVVVSE